MVVITPTPVVEDDVYISCIPTTFCLVLPPLVALTPPFSSFLRPVMFNTFPISMALQVGTNLPCTSVLLLLTTRAAAGRPNNPTPRLAPPVYRPDNLHPW